MQLKLFRHTWGMPGDWASQCAAAKAAGYAGLETNTRWPRPGDTPERLRTLLDQHGLDLVLQIFTQGDAEGRPTVEAHLASFERQVREALPYRPTLINAHSGRDSWSLDESLAFYRGVAAIERACPVVVTHELHRGRPFFNPRDTRWILERVPEIRVTADFSHWVCVCESDLRDQMDAVRLAAERTWHIHARVGHPEGPQVNDPRAPEWDGVVKAHEAWWDLVWDAQAKRGQAVSTLTPEFGPPGYQPTLPYTKAPLADLAEICDWQAKRQADRFAARAATAAAAR